MNIMIAMMAPVAPRIRVVEPLKQVGRIFPRNRVLENPVNHENEERYVFGKRKNQEEPQPSGQTKIQITAEVPHHSSLPEFISTIDQLKQIARSGGISETDHGSALEKVGHRDILEESQRHLSKIFNQQTPSSLVRKQVNTSA